MLVLKIRPKFFLSHCACVLISVIFSCGAQAALSISVGQAVKLSVTASGTAPFTYKWYKDGVALSGATAASFSITSMQLSNVGTYYAVVSNSSGSTSSDQVSLDVVSPIVFTTQPASKTASIGSGVTFTVAASSLLPLSYQWRKNGANITGATGASFSIADVSADSAGLYSVVVRNLLSFANSAGATLTVSSTTSTPVFTTQPTSKTVVAGSAVTFSASASGSPSPTYQWRKNGTTISGATDSSYTIASVASTSAGTYSVVATNSVGSVVSNGAALTVSTTTTTTNTTTNAFPGGVDFNGDGQTDLVWRNLSTGECVVWLMSGTKIASKATVGSYVFAWQLKGAADFNGDGKSDLLWENTSTGERSIWVMSGTTVVSRVTLGIVATAWEIKGAGDFNGDGQSDIIWQNNTTGERSIWYMSGTTVQSKVSLGVVGLDWEICGSGDFNGDGKSDILWQNILTDDRVLWLMSGSTIIGNLSLGTVAADWEIGGGGDFNGDGKSDIVWQNIATGECVVWLMSGTKSTASISVGVQSPAWVLGN